MLGKMKWFLLPVFVFSFFTLFIYNHIKDNDRDYTIDSGKSNLIITGESNSIRSKTASEVSDGTYLLIKDQQGWYWDIEVNSDGSSMIWSSRNTTSNPSSVYIPAGNRYDVYDLLTNQYVRIEFAWGNSSYVRGSVSAGTIYADPDVGDEYIKISGRIVNIDVNASNWSTKTSFQDPGSVSLSSTTGTVSYGSSSATFRVYSSTGTISVSDNNATATVSYNSSTKIVTISNISTLTAGTNVIVTVTSEETSNYEEVSKTYTLTIVKATPTITVNMTGYTYGGTKSTPSVSGNSGNGTVTYYYNTTNSNSGGTAWSGVSSATSLNAGTYYMYAVVAGTTNYNGVTTQTKSFTISKATPSITVNMNGYTYGGTKSTPSVSGNSGNGTVTYYYNTTNSNSGGTAWSGVSSATSLNAGTYYMYAVVSGTTNYNAATTSTKSFVISKATPTITVNMTDYTYGGTKSTPTVNGNSENGTVTYYYNTTDSASGGTVWSSVTSGSSLNAGTYYMYAVVAETTNYNGVTTQTKSFTIAKATPTVIVNMTDYTYGGTKSTPTVNGNSGNGTVTYYYNTTNSNSGGTAWSGVSNATSLNAGTYYMYAVVAETTNYNGVTTSAESFTIEEARITNITIVGYKGVYDGVEHAVATTATATVLGNQELTWEYRRKNVSVYSRDLKLVNVLKYTIYYKVSAPNHITEEGSFEVEITAKPIELIWNTESMQEINGIWSYEYNNQSPYREVSSAVQTDDICERDKEYINFVNLRYNNEISAIHVGKYTVSIGLSGNGENGEGKDNYCIEESEYLKIEIIARKVKIALKDKQSVYGETINLGKTYQTDWDYVEGKFLIDEAHASTYFNITTEANQRSDVGRYAISGSQIENAESKDYTIEIENAEIEITEASIIVGEDLWYKLPTETYAEGISHKYGNRRKCSKSKK